jgi:DNA-directed RNA polymerase subunit RPC12/RpoP
MRPEIIESVHCATCGKKVSGHDPDLGLVVRAYVQCPECCAIPVCINCRHRFVTETEMQYSFARERVGPFCGNCAALLFETFDATRRPR